MNKQIPIFFTTDDNYVPMLMVALNSIKKYSNINNDYLINIVYSKLSDNSKQKLKNFSDNNFKINFVDISTKLSSNVQFHVRDYYSITTYFRLFLPNMFKKIDKALYLDCDIVVKTDIANLFNIDIKDNLVGAVPDEAMNKIYEFLVYTNDYLGVNAQDYFNAGILIMNFKALREFNFEEKFVNLLKQIKFTVAQDQDYLNVICKDRVKYLDLSWNKMPLDKSLEDNEVNIIHYNLNFKPWRYKGINYEEYFWQNAKECGLSKELEDMRSNFSLEKQKIDEIQEKKLKENALNLANVQGGYKSEINNGIIKFEKNTTTKSKERLEILEKIKYLEENEIWDKDVENDPPTIPLNPDDVDYLNTKLSNKIKTKIANYVGNKFYQKLLKDKQYIFKGVEGLEKIKNIKGGAIITCNHFNIFDNYAVLLALRELDKNAKLYRVIREGNYSFTGKIGFFMRHCNNLPLSQNTATMMKFLKAIDTLLIRGEKILVYPEQAMWWNYRKPRPLKDGAYKFAVRNNVPVIAMFITLKDSDLLDNYGFPVQEYTVHILDVIYPDKNLTSKENVDYMKNRNYELNKQTYERVYNTKLDYSKKAKKSSI